MMTSLIEKMLNDRPHPGPLPQERVQQPHGLFYAIDCSVNSVAGHFVRRRMIPPLPRGEGRGEGGRNH